MSDPEYHSDLLYPAADGWGIADYPAAHDAIANTHHRMSRFFQGRQVYVGASKLIYFSEAAPHDRLAADLIVVIDPPLGTGPRGAWLT